MNNYDAPYLALKLTGFGTLATWPFTATRQAAVGAERRTATFVDRDRGLCARRLRMRSAELHWFHVSLSLDFMV